MKSREKTDNRKALPKFIGIIVIAGFIGAILGAMLGFTGATHLPEQIVTWIDTGLTWMTPWSICVLSLVFLGAGTAQYRTARTLFHAWDGEDEVSIARAEHKLGWALLWSSLNLIVNFFFFGIAYFTLGIEEIFPAAFLLFSFVLSMVGITILQQKIVDLTRKMNPEKHGSIYDVRFQKKWLASCDENERQKIGQAAFQSYNAVNYACMGLWLVLILLSLVFEIRVLPFFIVTLIWCVSLITYTSACLRDTKRQIKRAE